jgi:hypothetical protein
MSGGAGLWEGIERSRNLSNTRLKELALEKHQLVLDFIFIFFCQQTSKGASSRKALKVLEFFPTNIYRDWPWKSTEGDVFFQAWY